MAPCNIPWRTSIHRMTPRPPRPLCEIYRHFVSADIYRRTATNNHLRVSASSVRDKRYPLSLKQRHRQITPGLRHQRVIVTECRKQRQQRLAGCIILPVALGRDQC